MSKTVEAVIDKNGNVQLLESVALVTIMEEEPITSVLATALLSQQALAEDWLRPEEDEAWLHLQLVR
ncbi:MAG: hypothetical protein GDA44_12435 [Prochloron sp. SP5CPC1]|nr:hypothetical protein [Candidatus Paraprochloron terpiosi SP5CPC1]